MARRIFPVLKYPFLGWVFSVNPGWPLLMIISIMICFELLAHGKISIYKNLFILSFLTICFEMFLYYGIVEAIVCLCFLPGSYRLEKYKDAAYWFLIAMIAINLVGRMV